MTFQVRVVYVNVYCIFRFLFTVACVHYSENEKGGGLPASGFKPL